MLWEKGQRGNGTWKLSRLKTHKQNFQRDGAQNLFTFRLRVFATWQRHHTIYMHVLPSIPEMKCPDLQQAAGNRQAGLAGRADDDEPDASSRRM